MNGRTYIVNCPLLFVMRFSSGNVLCLPYGARLASFLWSSCCSAVGVAPDPPLWTVSVSLDRFRLFGPDPAKKGGSASLDRIRLFGPDTAKKGGSATLCDSKYLNYSAQLADTEVTRVRIRHLSQGKNSEDRQSHCI